jgi:hypothetical protein
VPATYQPSMSSDRRLRLFLKAFRHCIQRFMERECVGMHELIRLQIFVVVEHVFRKQCIAK